MTEETGGSLMELVNELTDAKTKMALMEQDLEAAKRSIDAQRRQLAEANPALLENANRARDGAQVILSKILPQVQPGTDIHREITLWLEAHSMRGNEGSQPPLEGLIS